MQHDLSVKRTELQNDESEERDQAAPDQQALPRVSANWRDLDRLDEARKERALVSGEIEGCPRCGGAFFHAVPGKTSKQEIVAFAQASNLRNAQHIIEEGWIHPGIYCPNGCTALMLNFGHSPITSDKEAEINEKEVEPARPEWKLVSAAASGELRRVYTLLKSGVPIDSAGETGHTALYEASVEGHADVVHLLLKRGAAVTGQPKENERVEAVPDRDSPIFNAAFYSHSRVVELLIRYGADADTALWAAAQHGHTDTMHLALRRGADPNAILWDYTVLMKAVAHRQTDAALLLLDSGADINRHVPASGRTALMRAAEQNYAPMMRLLLEHGADTNLRDRRGESALDIAKKLDKTQMTELLSGSGET